MGAQYTFNTILDPLETALPRYLNVNGVGDVFFPISTENLQKLKDASENITCGQGYDRSVNPTYCFGFCLRGGNIIAPLNSTLRKAVDHWINTSLCHIGINSTAIRRKVSISRLLIYPAGGHHMQQLQLPEEAGHFASLRLQLPTQGGYLGGVLTVEDCHRCFEFDNSRDSGSCFYVTVTHVQSEFGLREITSGCRVELVFNLLWTPPTPSFYPDIREISLFLATLSKLYHDIGCWCTHNVQDGPVKMFIIRLENVYDPTKHSFSSLANPDRLVAYLFRSLDMVEVNLAYLTRITRAVEVNNGVMPNVVVGTRHFKFVSIAHSTTHWIDVNDRAIRLFDLDIDSQCHGISAIIEPNRTPNRVEIKSHSRLRTTLELEHNLSALILWPKSKSFHVTLRHRFEHLLHLLEMEVDQQCSLEMLRSILDHESEWPKTEQNICKLLNICRRLQAKEEAIKLLEMLASCSIGVCSKDVGDLIPQINCEILGWPICQLVVKKLLDVNPTQNLHNFVCFAENFLIRASFDAFMFVADRTLDVFFQCEDSVNRDTKAACVKLLILLAEHSLVLSSKRSAQFLDSFRRWSPLNQCNLITDLENVWTSQPEKSRLLFDKLSNCFVYNVSPSVSSVVLIDFFSMLLTIHDRNLYVFDVFSKSLSLQPNCFPNNFLRDLVSTFEEIDAPREFFIQVLNARFVELQSKIVHGEAAKWVQEGAQFPAGDQYPEIVSFLHLNQQATRTESFGGLGKAKEFASKYFEPIEECLKLGYCAIATAYCSGKKTYVSIVKTPHLHRARQTSFKEELEQLLNKLTALGVPPPSSYLVAPPVHGDASNDLNVASSNNTYRIVTRSRSRSSQSNKIL